MNAEDGEMTYLERLKLTMSRSLLGFVEILDEPAIRSVALNCARDIPSLVPLPGIPHTHDQRCYNAMISELRAVMKKTFDCFKEYKLIPDNYDFDLFRFYFNLYMPEAFHSIAKAISTPRDKALAMSIIDDWEEEFHWVETIPKHDQYRAIAREIRHSISLFTTNLESVIEVTKTDFKF